MSNPTKPDPRWLPVTSITQLPTSSTQFLEGGMYRFESATTTYVIIDDEPITVFPNSNNSALILRGEYETQYQYIAPGQYLRSNTSSGTMVKLG